MTGDNPSWRDRVSDMEREKKELAAANRYVKSLDTNELNAAWASLLCDAPPYRFDYLFDRHPRTDKHAAWELWVAAGRPEV